MRVRAVFFVVVAAMALLNVEGLQRQDKIAIIGGGASGVSCAYLLKKSGYRRITIFEAKRSVGGVAKTIRLEGKAYDKAAMFVPGSTLFKPGIEPTLQDMIEASGEKLVPALDFNAYGPINSMNTSIELLPPAFTQIQSR